MKIYWKEEEKGTVSSHTSSKAERVKEGNSMAQVHKTACLQRHVLSVKSFITNGDL